MSFQPEKISESWQSAKKPSKRFRPGDPETQVLETNNRFSPLHTDEMDLDSTENSDNTSNVLNEEPKSGKTKIPSIVLHSWIKNHAQTMETLKKDLKEDFLVVTKRDRIIIKTLNVEDYNKVLDTVKSSKIECHTFNLPGTSPLKLILKGLPPNISPEEIKEDLISRNFKVRVVKQFVKNVEKDGNKMELKLPIYSVEFDPNTLAKDVFAHKKVCWCLIHWEKYKTKNRIIQCFKCQAYGHYAKNCFKNQKCVLCTGAHALDQCPLKHKPGQLLKCANCGKNHSAGSRDCDVYKRILESREKQNSAARAPNVRSPRNNHNRISFGNNNNTAFNNRVSYSQAAGQRLQDSSSSSESSISDLITELKNIFGNINFFNIFNVIKNLINSLKNETDTFGKIMLIIEAIGSFF